MPPHVPPVQTSPVVHALPSLHAVPLPTVELVQTLFTQLATWHWSDGAHVPPQVTVPPQPSEIVPQLSPAGHEVSGVHAMTSTCAVAEWTADVAWPMTVKVVGLAETGALAAAESVNVEVAPATTLAGLNDPVTPVGRS